MPATIQQGSDQTVQMRLTIKRMFANCPKPSGWFGCYAHVRGDDGDIRLFGTTNLSLTDGMVLDVKARKSLRYNDNGTDDAWDAVEMAPVTKTRTGMIGYLASLPGISRPTAIRLVTAYGSDILDVAKNDPDRIKREMNFSDTVMEKLRDGILSGDGLNQLKQMFPQLGPQLAKRVHETWPDAISIIRNDPYRLCEIPGISFKLADTIAMESDEIHVEPTSTYRVNHGLVYILDTEGGNDLFTDLNDKDQVRFLTAKLESLLRIRMDMKDELRLRAEALAQAQDSPVVIENKNGQERLFLTATHTAVRIVTDYISNAARMPVAGGSFDADIRRAMLAYQQQTGFLLTDEQKNAILSSARAHASVITGGPGRGKTTIVDCLTKALQYALPGVKINLLAPTGRAMNKLRSATKSAFPTMTVDRLLVSARHEKSPMVNPASPENLNTGAAVFIIDESSMLDMEKIASLIDTFPKARYVFVGDIDQLPPIGKGRFLQDVIACGKIPVSYLTTPQRNGGTILANATKIAAGDPNLQWDFVSMPFFPQADDSQATLDFILEQYHEECQECPDPTEIALLCPIRRGPVGVVSLNIAMQEAACPERMCQPVTNARHGMSVFSQKGHSIQTTIYGSGEKWTRFRVGDIVMNTKNQYGVMCYKYSDDDYWNGTPMGYEPGIFNGDCGRIIGYAPSWLPNDSGITTPHEFIIVQLFNGRFVQIDVTLGEFESFELGYAMTVHKSQGCEYRTVIYVSPHSMASMAHAGRSGFAVRNLPYTGVTRAKERVVVIGSKESIATCVQNQLPPYNSDFCERVS